MSYKVKPMGAVCAATGEDLLPGDWCYSVLIEEGGEQVRRDYSENAWDGPPEDAIGVWRRRVPEAEQVRAKPLDTEALWRFFLDLCDQANPIQETFRYVVALLLLRKKRLVMDGSRVDGDIEYLQLVGCNSEGPFEVRNCDLAPEEVQALEAELNSHLYPEE